MAKRENSIYSGIAKDIESKIISGEYKNGVLLPPERVLKEMYGVERTTIRRALDLLSERGIITKKAGFGNMVGGPDTSENAKKSTGIQTVTKKSGLIIYIGASQEHTPYTKALEGICKSSGYSFLQISSSDIATLSKVTSSNDCFGAVISENDSDKVCNELGKRGIPYVFAFTNKDGCRCVVPDYYGAMSSLVGELYSKGHRKIAYIGKDANETLVAFTKAIKDAGIDADSDYISISRGTEESSYNDFLSLYRRLSGRFTAIITDSTESAKGAIRAANEKGLDVPKQISFACLSHEPYDNITCAIFDKDTVAHEILLTLENQSTQKANVKCVTSVGHNLTGSSIDTAPGSRRNTMSDFLL